MRHLGGQGLGLALVAMLASLECSDQQGLGDGSLEGGVPDMVPHRDRRPDLGRRDQSPKDAPAPAAPWVFLAGGRYGRAEAYDIHVEGTGHVMAAGVSIGEVPFGPVLHKQPGVLVTRLSPAGKLDWVKGLSSPGGSFGPSICLDVSGRIVVAGAFSGTRAIGPKTITSKGNTDIFVAWVDTKGNVLSVVSFGGHGWDGVDGIACHPGGNLYIAGNFDGAVDFGGTTLVPAGGNDVYVAKLDAQGSVLWAVGGGGDDEESVARFMAVDAGGNVYIGVNVWAPATFGSIAVEPKSAHDAVVLKLGSSGKFLWATQGSGNKLYLNGLALDSAGNPHVTGSFDATAKIGKKTLEVTASSLRSDLLVAKLSPLGEVEWAVAVADAEGLGIAVDGAGNSYVTGNFAGYASFGSFGLAALGWQDIFVAKLGPSRNWLGAASAGGKLVDGGTAIALDASGNVHVTGTTHASSTNPSAVNKGAVTFGKQTFQLDGAQHLFVWKIPAGQL